MLLIFDSAAEILLTFLEKNISSVSSLRVMANFSTGADKVLSTTGVLRTGCKFPKIGYAPVLAVFRIPERASILKTSSQYRCKTTRLKLLKKSLHSFSLQHKSISGCNPLPGRLFSS